MYYWFQPIVEYSVVYIQGTDNIWDKVGFLEIDIGISTVSTNVDVWNGFLYEAFISDMRQLKK